MATVASALALTADATAATPTVTEFGSGIEDGDGPFGITPGPDGNVWFTNRFSNEIVELTPTGTVTEYALSSPSALPHEIVGGRDGNLWFTEFGTNKIGKMTTSGTLLSEYTIPTANSDPLGITAGPLGALWFTETNADKVANVTTSGTFAEYALPAGAEPADVTLGPDGNLFITEPGIDRVARIEPDGAPIMQFGTGIPAGADPTSITTSPQGVASDLWFTEPGIDKIGRIDPSAGPPALIQASLTHFDAGLTAGAYPTAITAGPDGDLWFTEPDIDEVGRINTDLETPRYLNADPININGAVANQGASTYPSTIEVAAPSPEYGPITDVFLRLTGLSHTYPDDIEILLVSPTGARLRVMSDAGGGGLAPADEVGAAVNGVTLNVSDSGVANIPDEGPLISGRYNAGQGTGSTSFPVPAPATPYQSTFASAFDGTSADGTWSLYVNDDTVLDTGFIHGGWGLDIETVGVANDDTIPARLEDAGPSLRNVLGNDTGTPLTIAGVTDPAHGTATIVGDPTEILYASDPDYCNSPGGSSDTFTYTIPSGDTATVSAPTITCVDDPSIAADDSRTVAEDSGTTSLDVTANDTDAFEEQTQITAATDPAHGTSTVIQGSPDTIAYAPDADYCNDAAPPDTFDYTVDGGDTATVSVAVTCAAEPSQPTPQTTITKAPKKLKAKSRRKPAKAKFEFSSSLPGATFECSLDGAAPKPCSSPASLKVRKGTHTFAVAAIAGGEKDPSPATATFKVTVKKKKS